MKKILSIACLAMLMLSFKAYSQSNLIWTVKDNVQKGFFKTATTFNTSFSGFTSKETAVKFYDQMKNNGDVKSVIVTNTDANGNADVKVIMKEVHDKMYYIGLAQKLGVAYIQINGDKKTPAELIAQKRAKKK